MDVARGIHILAPAKLNLFLEVLHRRADGFHEIETLMAAVSLYDSLYFLAQSDGRLQLACDWASGMEANHVARGANVDCTLGHLPSGPENIVYRILERFKEAARVSQGARVRLIKRIPSAAGLGGASSDAAAALWAANRAWQVGWPAARLAEFAAESGSDIPFFLAARGDEPLALCQGRGEQIRGVKLPVSLPVVVARPAVGLSTPQVYQACRAAPSPRPVQPMIEALRGGDIRSVGSLLFNRLEFAASRFTPWIGRLRSWFQHRDVVGFGMSGSGSSCFAICRHGGQSQRIAGQLRAEGLAEVFCARTVARHCQVVTTGAVPQDSS